MVSRVYDSRDACSHSSTAIAMLVTDANFDVDEDGLKLQAMDNSHVALTSLELNASAFSDYRCDRNLSLGMNIASLQKMIKCAGNADEVTLRADNNVDVLDLVFQDTSALLRLRFSGSALG